PVLMIRSEHDGITTNEDTLAFFDALATKDKQLVTMSGQAHNVTFGVNRHRFWYVLQSFLGFPERRDDLPR
ncbi:MAG TPA: alpha/beta hydrolase, partial [Afifellaceae bacterium]|nr:alpha/beta hydrolase [Afifellaceae bacterium]